MINSGGIVRTSWIVASLYMGNAVLIPARAGDTAVLPKIVIMEMDNTASCSFRFTGFSPL